ncbi:MAG: tRNA (adenosine(37)-N6)-threonylcarbamoyltransferase complex ATPase subunit type 1 TsaE [Maricaulaceae bacterium]
MTERFISEILLNEAALIDFGASLAQYLRIGDVLSLSGDLGAGKTTFSRGVIQSILGAVEVPSPTYTLVQTYECPDYELWHCDLYRLEAPTDVLELGLVDMEEDIVSLIEWPDKMGSYLSPQALNVHIGFHETGREISLSGPDNWAERLKGFQS